ncbi:hypothetical protein M8C21_022330 [Ambrosia artemisiifolia]|uniref:Uncharacterized protein n=1 Tax=Ambrosia artemisiifolia TaxID=4212 RepID=A0AAD5C7N6_AMBAR|nr:hypothetical protein M8C21_022330 [Ambrosia artemisiifolia]
MTQLKIRTL